MQTISRTNSAAPSDCRVAVPDPTDAKADGAFGGTHRAGYGTDRLDRIIATARKGWTLAAGEGLVLVQEIDRLRRELELVSSEAADAFNDRDAAEANAERRWDDIIAAAKKIERLERTLAALREPSEAVIEEAAWVFGAYEEEQFTRADIEELSREFAARALQAAVAVAEREVAG